ncbi:MAG: 1,4-alpha-glucan branching protein GlgB [Steroidobacteraceae bacterium]
MPSRQKLTVSEIEALVQARHPEPRSLLGYHEYARKGGEPACMVRALEPAAEHVEVIWDDSSAPSTLKRIHDAGLFEGRVPYRRPLSPYRLRIRYRDGVEHVRHDAYYFSPQITDFDLYLFGEGNHHRIYLKLGAHPIELDGTPGTRFAVWAPNAERVSVVGSFNLWDGRRHAMQMRGSSGIWELFVPDVGPGTTYKYEIRTPDGRTILKSDPFGFAMQLRPDNCSVVASLEGHDWGDQAWMEARRHARHPALPINIYELHPGSWRRRPDRTPPFPNWRELADELIPYVRELGYTHVELMGIAEHPFDRSWGYQVAGYYAPTARYGSPQDFMHFVDRCHQAGLGVILDWVPAHFPRDEHGLAGFDGTALYEHADPRLGEHADWGTKIFNYGRHEVRNFLVANALYWLDRYHVDGLRVDAVASMLYLDYSRRPGEWLPNRYGGRENLEAIEFLKQLNVAVGHYHPGAMTIAEESTAYPGVTRPVHLGGLGFHFKWNMGWMNDTLRYAGLDPVHRRFHHDLVTFSFMYAWSENFVLPVSHDEVVHGKGSLLGRMPGDEWQKRANYRLMRAYMTAHPGKKLLFMGSEFGQWHEWRDEESLDWQLLDDPRHRGLLDLNRDLNRMYADLSALHAGDADPAGFGWIDLRNADQSVFAFLRRDPSRPQDPPIVCVFNATPVPRDDYWIGVPEGGRYTKLLDTDAPRYGGSGYDTRRTVAADDQPSHGYPHCLRLRLPPLAALYLRPDRQP